MSRAKSTRLPAMRYRHARRPDVEQLAELALRSYRIRTIEAQRQFYTDHPRFAFTDVRVGEVDGALVSSLVLVPFHAFVRGMRLPVRGVGGVAVSPEHRRRGIGEAMVRAALREMRQRGDAFSMLYAFRSDFYQRLGYGLIERSLMISTPPALIPASPEVRRVRRARLPDRPGVEQLYARLAEERGHFAFERRPEWWARRLWEYEGDWVVYEKTRGRIEGYLQYQVDSGDGPWKLVINVNEMLASTPEAQRGLWGYLHGLRDQAVEVTALVADDFIWPVAVADPANLHGELKLFGHRSRGHAGYGAMLRIVDVKAAFEAMPVAREARGEVAFDVKDDVLPANQRVWRVHATGGRLEVRVETARMQGSRSRLPRLTLSVDMLASVMSGSLSPVIAAEAGLVADVRDGAAIVESWFRARPAFVHPFNAF